MLLETSRGDRRGLSFDFGWLSSFGAWFDKSDPYPEDENLVRLAATSPHLLADIGFRQDPDGSWSNGRQRIAAPSKPSAELSLRTGGVRA